MTGKPLIIFLLLSILIFFTDCKKADGTDEDDNILVNSGNIGENIGDTLKSFTETDSNGNTFSFETFKGKVILLNISAMWCGPCRSEASELMEIYNTYKGRGFEIVQCIYQDENAALAAQSDIQRWVNEFLLSFIVVNDTDGSLVNFFSFSGIPFNVIIGKDFVIKYRREGFYKSEIIRKIEDLL